jgi:hypothetical protein
MGVKEGTLSYVYPNKSSRKTSRSPSPVRTTIRTSRSPSQKSKEKLKNKEQQVLNKDKFSLFVVRM